MDDLSEENKYINVKPIAFPSLDEQISGANFNTNFFSNIPVKIDVMLGNTTISLKEVYDLTEGSIIELDKLFGEPLELKISGQLVALGEVVSVNDRYGIMLKEIIKNKS
ncbi:MAG: flagellar motor switch protein FliN [Candidatus Margulisbacteria bacterium GWF2_35_9]|nr:MAG: flagellar motor switch protein FliN [Candidatus Margulisbacteria bacterium GWF2_35_9]